MTASTRDDQARPSRPQLDRAISKLLSRKLLGWLVATVLLALGHIEPADWVAITGIWIGTEGAQNLVEAWRPQARTIIPREPVDEGPFGGKE